MVILVVLNHLALARVCGTSAPTKFSGQKFSGEVCALPPSLSVCLSFLSSSPTMPLPYAINSAAPKQAARVRLSGAAIWAVRHSVRTPSTYLAERSVVPLIGCANARIQLLFSKTASCHGQLYPSPCLRGSAVPASQPARISQPSDCQPSTVGLPTEAPPLPLRESIELERQKCAASKTRPNKRFVSPHPVHSCLWSASQPDSHRSGSGLFRRMPLDPSTNHCVTANGATDSTRMLGSKPHQP